MEALLNHGEGLLVPERMIIAPSVGVFRPLDDVDEGDHVDEGQTVGAPRRSRHVDAGVQPVPRPARGHARPPRRAPPRGPAGRLAASRLSMRAAIAGWGTALPEQRLTNAELEQRVDTTDQWIVERTGIRERRIAGRRRDHRQPRHRGGRRRDQARRASRPTPSTSSIVATATHRAAHPPHRRVRRRRPRPALRLVRPQRRVRRVRLRARRRLRRCSPAGNLEHVLVDRRRDAVARHRPHRPRHLHPLRRRRRRVRARARRPTTGPGSSRGTSGATARPPACSRSRRAAAGCPTTAETVANGEHFLKMAGQEVFRRAVRIVVESATTALERAGVAVDDVTWFVAAPGQRPHHRSRRQPARDPGGAHAREHRPLRQHVSAASIPLVLAEAADDGRLARRRPRPPLAASAPA